MGAVDGREGGGCVGALVGRERSIADILGMVGNSEPMLVLGCSALLEDGDAPWIWLLAGMISSRLDNFGAGSGDE